ncbi:MAG: hypothetical protein J6S58_03505 [Lentisphaeria bacterium]|nr:hypothetical protein [Lentisphaeria bacterium]
MYSLLIALFAGLLSGSLVRFISLAAAGESKRGVVSVSWCVVIGCLVFIAVMIVISQIIRARIKKVNARIQQVMEEVQHKLMLKQNQFMRRPQGSPKAMMQALEKDQAAGLRLALDACEGFTPFFRWSPLLDRQAATMKMAFHYQLREFDKVDEYMKKCLFFDPQSVCMKLARMYVNKDPSLDKFFKKKCSSYKEPACILPYALYSWILVKQERYEEALRVLVEAKKKTDNEVIVHNWELLANKKYKNFSNAGLAESWYALGLEEPKIQKQQQVYRYR